VEVPGFLQGFDFFNELEVFADAYLLVILESLFASDLFVQDCLEWVSAACRFSFV